MSVGCPCCSSQTLVFVGFVFVALRWLLSIGKTFAEKNKYVNIVFQFLFWSTSIIVGAIAIILASLSYSNELRQIIFSRICLALSKNESLDKIRCDLLSRVEGRVLEIGPGPGTNFRCWRDANISEWVGVEPNEYFKPMLYDEKVKRNISFPIKTVWLNGENIDVNDNSFDAVVTTHLFCSVNDIDSVLRQISRVLKNGGKFYFLEHVLEQEKNSLYYSQKIVEPFFTLFGNGCQFKQTWKYFTNSNPALSAFEINFEHFKAPVGMSFMVPHIRGHAVKSEVTR